MIKLNREELKDKITACWIGKNIGGTLAGPYEGKREVLDVKGFTTEPGNPLPNDDLDLQMVWLKAMEEHGPFKLNERILAEYWMEYIPPYWNEYGVGKGNMSRGLVPPICGEYQNDYKHSNGAFIRTEVWATLFPALVDETIKFAYMDSCIDHGQGEGTYATIFVAAIESSAFVVNDLRELINIGLSKIPEDCRMSKHIRAACDAYDSGKTWLEARNIVTDMSLADPELGWFQAPANVAYAIIGLLYGEGDFKKTLLITTNCGDDTDCSCATAGSILGIMHGTKIIPKDWQEYIGDKIVSIAINLGACYDLPKTCTEMTERILAQHYILAHYRKILWPYDPNKHVQIVDGETEFTAEDVANFSGMDFVNELSSHSPYGFTMDFVLSKVWIDYDRAPDITPGGEIKVKVTLKSKFLSKRHYEYNFILPEGWTISGEKKNIGITERKRINTTEYTITAGEKVDFKNKVILEISCDGRSEIAYVPMVFLG